MRAAMLAGDVQGMYESPQPHVAQITAESGMSASLCAGLRDMPADADSASGGGE